MYVCMIVQGVSRKGDTNPDTRVQDQRNLKANNCIGQEHNSRPNKFTMWFKSKVWKNEVALTWYHVLAKSQWSRLKKSLLLV